MLVRRHSAVAGLILGWLLLLSWSGGAEAADRILAQVGSPDEVAQALADQGYHVDPGEAVDESALAELVAETRRDGYRMMFAVLGGAPPGGAVTFADAVLDRVGSGTVVVLTPDELGYSSVEFDSDQLNEAADDSLSAFGRDPVEGFRAFADSAIPGGVSGADAESGESGGGGGGGLVILLVILAAAVGVFLFVRWRNRRKDEERMEENVEEAKQEIRSQLSSMANAILELSDQVTMTESAEAKEHFRQANESYAAATDQVERITSVPELEELSDRLDRARWQLDATRALLEGRPLPPQPAEGPAACFFDPTHGAGTERAQIQTAAGSKAVGVCSSCAEKLQRGERPVPRTIPVNGRPVPAPYAPRSYGGGGYGWLDAFSILFGTGTPVYYRVGRRPRRVRFRPYGMSGSGGWGGGSFGGRSRMPSSRGRGGMRIGRARGGRRR
jgi:type II secretory pathway pseudopilin PulG